jgi:FKBP-type peptidyl-prolyl cis-trans isomerase
LETIVLKLVQRLPLQEYIAEALNDAADCLQRALQAYWELEDGDAYILHLNSDDIEEVQSRVDWMVEHLDRLNEHGRAELKRREIERLAIIAQAKADYKAKREAKREAQREKDKAAHAEKIAKSEAARLMRSHLQRKRVENTSVARPPLTPLRINRLNEMAQDAGLDI